MSTAKQKWARLVREWRRSGATAAQYARSAGVNAGTLSYWAWRLGREERAAEPTTKTSASRAQPPAEFIEVVATTGGRGRFEVVLDNGRRVFVPDEFDGAALGRLLAVLEGQR